MADGMLGVRYPIRGYEDREKNSIGSVSYEEIKELKTEFFYLSWRLYTNYKLFGLPHGSGWASERNTVLEIIRILEEETNAHDAWEMEQNRPSR